ncbi:hypothetical protein CAPTEDRAFT_187461 [Capitella teleta]|uniref:Homeobox domain-containing protein n=1 Tax=Capitella teleta TaxID=283909 RepID=R7VKF2_CAPTE|nr:hypothetical protein CAPTEDRAFT_187461 [Capitella teleta]|eukprot:ELU17321.1 hypothetical protein CAPTEDRAFT_187461 [Capitella teleta]
MEQKSSFLIRDILKKNAESETTNEFPTRLEQAGTLGSESDYAETFEDDLSEIPFASDAQTNAQYLSSISPKCKKPRRRRTAFTHAQLQFLERKFRCQKYLSVADRADVAETLN